MEIKTLLIFFHFFAYLNFALYGQNSAYVEYKAFNSDQKIDTKKMANFKKSKPVLYRRIMETNQNVSFLLKEARFPLKILNNESLFELKPTVEHENNKFIEMVKIITGTKDITYYNSNTTNKIIQRQAFGKTYIIESS